MIGGSEPEGALSCSSGRAEATQPGGRLHAEHFNPKREQRSNSMVTKRSRGRRGGSPDSSSLRRNHGCGALWFSSQVAHPRDREASRAD